MAIIHARPKIRLLSSLNRLMSYALIAALLMALGAAAQARDSPAASPSQRFGELFSRVQTERLYADSKTFADASPKFSPQSILRSYRAARPASRADLARFVAENFELPSDPVIAQAPSGGSVESHIASLWPVLTRSPTIPSPYSSRLFVPSPYVVPGGRFREFYYWDSYFTMLGLVLDGHENTARGLVADFGYLIDRYGHVPNGARTYYLSRSQPPFFYLMIGLLSHDSADAYVTHLGQLRREYAFWMHGAPGLAAGKAREHVVVMADGSLLNRYWDALQTPRDEAYREDLSIAESSGRDRQEMYRNLRATAESGWDFSSRWLGDGRTLQTIRTTAIVPVDLNSLLYGLEETIAAACRKIKNNACAQEFSGASQRRRAAMQRYLWDTSSRRFSDYDWRLQRRTDRLSAATLYPLFVGLATPDQAAAVAATVREKLMKPGGLVCTQVQTGQQWDAPNGWPPLQWIAVLALDGYGQKDLAHELASRWISTVRRVYAQTGKLLEKYDVQTVRPGGGGEYPLQDGFGWTNGVTRALLDRYPDLKTGASGAP